jgi:hypothetical protein
MANSSLPGMPQQIASMVERADAGEPPLSGFGV